MKKYNFAVVEEPQFRVCNADCYVILQFDEIHCKIQTFFCYF